MQKVYFDHLLQFDKHVDAVLKSSFFHLRSVAKVKHFLSMKDLEIVIHALISSQLDNCNSLYIALPEIYTVSVTDGSKCSS